MTRGPVETFVGAVLVFIAAGVVLSIYGWWVALGPVLPFLAALLWLAILTLASWGIGRPIHRALLGSLPHDWVDLVVTVALGAGGLAGAVAVLALFGLLDPILVLAVLTAFTACGAIQAHRSRPPFAWPLVFRWWSIPALLAAGMSLAAATTLAPFYDQLHYHLGLPFHWLRYGTLIVFDREAYSFLPCTTSLLYTYALAGPGGWAAQVIHWGLGALAAAGAAGIVRRLDGPQGAAPLAAALIITTPAVFESAALAAADLAAAAFAAAAVITLVGGIRRPETLTRNAAAAGILAGLAAGAKLLALGTVVAPVAVVLAVHAIRRAVADRRLRHATAPLLLFVAGVALTTGPWMARNLVVTGNPVYPYFGDVVSTTTTPRANTGQEIAAGVGAIGISRERIASTLTLHTFTTRGHAGRIGPIHLMLLPLALLWSIVQRHRARVRALNCIVALALGASMWAPPLGRYLLSTLTLLAPLAACGWAFTMNQQARWIERAATMMIVLAMLGGLNPMTAGYLKDQLKVFLGAADGDSLLAHSSSQWTAIQAANRLLPTSSVVLLVAESRVYGLDRDVIVDDPFRTPLLVELAQSTRSAEEISDGVASMGVTHLLINRREAERLAVVTGRRTYLECDSPEAADRLRLFVSSHSTVVWQGSSSEIRVLLGRSRDVVAPDPAPQDP